MKNIKISIAIIFTLLCLVIAMPMTISENTAQPKAYDRIVICFAIIITALMITIAIASIIQNIKCRTEFKRLKKQEQKIGHDGTCVIIDNLIRTFNDAISNKMHYNPVPPETLAKLSVDLRPHISTLIEDKTKVSNIMNLFYNILSNHEYGIDIPNGSKDDILFVTQEYVKAIQLSQYAILTIRQLLSGQNLSGQNIEDQIPNAEYETLHLAFILCIINNQDESSQIIAKKITDCFYSFLKLNHVTFTLYYKDHRELKANLELWANKIL